MLAALRTLTPTRHGLDRYVPSIFLDTIVLSAEPAGVREDSRPVLGSLNMMPGLGIAQQAHQRSLPVQEWEIARACSIKSKA
jgi:hypothetical protein